MSAPDVQGALFDLRPSVGEGLAPNPDHAALAGRLPRDLRLGTTSWSFPGWAGILYPPNVTAAQLARHGLPAYAKNSLLRAVEIDRTYYGPLPAEALRAFAADVGDDFRFLVKAHELCTVLRFPRHARYGKKRGELNPRYLDSAYATDAVVGPFREGLGEKGGALIFQFPPQAVESPRAFAEDLHGFLSRLPRGVTYAVELRNAELLTRDYASALEATGAVHCHNVWTAMPSVLQQAKLIPPSARRPLVLRWLLRQGDVFEDARARYAPFDRLLGEDQPNRSLVADLVARAQLHDVPALVVVDNKAEGCAPESVFRLAARIIERAAELRPRALRR
jgi:uncharacterized protein YecE (DUF72 family)